MEIEIPNSAYFVLRYTDPDDSFGFLEKKLCFICAVKQSLNCKDSDKIYTCLYDEKVGDLCCDECGKNIGSTTF